MGQNITKLYTVSLCESSDMSKNDFRSIQEAIDAAEPGSTIILSHGDHYGFNNDPIYLKSAIKFIGLQGTRIMSPVIGEVTDVVFENIIFKNKDNNSLEFRNGKGYLFKNCEFHINIGKYDDKNIRFGFHLMGGSAILQNPIFCIDVNDTDVFVAIGADNGSKYLCLQSPIIRVQYSNVNKLETFFFHGNKDSNENIPYFEAFSSSIHYKNQFIYDGHCCLKKRKQCFIKHCNKEICSCKRSHSCCDKHCKIISSSVRLFRGLNHINITINNTKVYFIDGHGIFNIADADSPIYINALTTSSNFPSNWEIGNFHNLLLTSFQSNLKYACEIDECHYVDEYRKEEIIHNHCNCNCSGKFNYLLSDHSIPSTP